MNAVAVVDRHDRGWAIYDGSGTRIQVGEPPFDDEAALCSYAGTLLEICQATAGIAIVQRAIAEEPTGRTFLAGAVPLYVLPADFIAAESIDSSTARLIAVAPGPRPAVSLMLRNRTGDVARAARPVCFDARRARADAVEKFVTFARSIGYESVAYIPQPSDEQATARFHDTARALVRRGFGDVFFRGGAAAAFEMKVERRLSFAVEHSAKPVFSIGNDLLASALGARECLIFVDAAVHALYGADLQRYAHERLTCLDIVVVDVTERSKTLERVHTVCAAATRAGIRRDGVFVACGGGVLLDLVGAAASMYRRGIDYFRLPTTLVGMIDVCVGIKQGINFEGRKNFLGAFYAPAGGINDRSFLRTLPRAEISAGIAEIIKVALLLDPPLFESIERYGPELLNGRFQTNPKVAEEVLLRAEFAMMRELQPNLWERELRRLVDFGHTFSSLIETKSSFTVCHGHAVALDMLLSTAIGVELGLCSELLLERLVEVYRRTELPLWHELLSLDLLRALPAMRAHRAGNLNLVVPLGLGAGTFLQDVSPGTMLRALEIVDAFGADVARPTGRSA